jgi:hypothetical protein
MEELRATSSLLDRQRPLRRPTALGGEARDESTLMEHLCTIDGLSGDLALPLKATLSRTYLLTKINFLRAFLNNSDPNAIYDHILYGLNMGPHSVCFGADYFYTESHPDQSRKPFFYKEQENASCYPSILKKLSGKVQPKTLEDLSHKYVFNFINRMWHSPAPSQNFSAH